MKNGIEQALKNGYTLGIWASGGGVRIVAIMNKDGNTVVSGESGFLSSAYEKANTKWFKHLKKISSNGRKQMSGAKNCKFDFSLFSELDHWVAMSGWIGVHYDNHSEIFIAKLDGYNGNIDKVIQLGFHQDLLKSIENAFNAPKVPKDR